MKLTAQGRLRHQFWGDYSATIAVAFDTPEDAQLALPHLAPPDLGTTWKIGTKHAKALTILVDSPQLEKLKVHLGTLGADVDAIDSCDHSIDYGDPFTVTVEVEDPKQMQLLAA
jgi:hypothetical protein